VLIGALFGAQATTETLRAEGTNAAAPAAPAIGATDTNTIELIRQMQRRIEELEHKVQTLERGKAPAEEPSEGKSKPQLEELDQKVKILERQRELDQEDQEAKAKEAPRISMGEDGFSFASAKGDFAMQLKGVVQVDSRTFFNEPGLVGNDGMLLRRARPILQGTVFQDFDFLFVPDFAPSSGPTIYDAYANYRYSPALQFQAGKFKVPFGLEQLAQDRDILFNERSLATDLVPNRDVGFELHGELFDGRASYAAGFFNGMTDGANSPNVDFADDRAFAGRLFFQPLRRSSATALRGFGFGLAGTYETMSTTNTAGLPSNTGGSLPGYFHRRPATVLCLQPGRQGRGGGSRRSLAAIPTGVLLLWAVRAARRVCHLRSESHPDGGGSIRFGALTEHGLGRFGSLGVDRGGRCFCRRSGSAATVQSS
jgi:phosphate-selective porin OprO/OprP